MFRTDLKSLAFIGVGTGAAVALTAALFAARSPAVRAEREVRPKVEIVEVMSVAGTPSADRLYGTVVAKAAADAADRALTGFIRWDTNEGAWSDLLEAGKPGSRNVSAAIRFGNVASITPTGRRSADITLRDGEVVRLEADQTDLGSSVRGIEVELDGGSVAKRSWEQLERVDFQPAPEDAPEARRRLVGTVVTSSGVEFSGHVTWDVREIFTTDLLDARDSRGRQYSIAFGNIRSITRESSSRARVVLTDGRELLMRGGSEIGTAIDGISVSDPGLGQVVIDRWNDFAEVRFGESEALADFEAFGEPAGIVGEVVMKDGRSFSGAILWDADESAHWEVLDGEADGVTFKIEFSRIASVTPDDDGSIVELKDGRSFYLTDSNDVDSSNEGLMLSDGERLRQIDWSDVREVRFRAP